MKNAIIGILAAIILMGAASEQLFTIKPAKPKSVVTCNFVYPNDIPAFVKKWTKQGYVVKSACGDGYWLVIMEKY